MKISVIIPTRNRLEVLIRCVKSISAQSCLPHELVIVDSSDQPIYSDFGFSKIENYCKSNGVTLVYKISSPGAAYQRNIGICLATGDILYFFDDDVVLYSDYIERMQEVFERYPEYYGGMGTITNPSIKFSFNRLLRFFFLMQRENASGKFTFSGMPTHAYGKKIFTEVQVFGGCGMSFRTEALKEFCFDEHLGRYSYMEDCDLSWRVSYKYKLFYNPMAILNHLHCPLARDCVCDNRAMYICNYSYLFFKNFYPKNHLKIVAYFWTVIGLFTEAILARNVEYIRGYVRGLKKYWFDKSFKNYVCKK